MRFLLAYLNKQSIPLLNRFRLLSIAKVNLQAIGMERTAHETSFVLSDNYLYLAWRNPSFGYLLPASPIGDCVVRAILVLEKMTVKRVGILSGDGDER